MTRTLTSLAALALLTGCSSDSSAPASTTTPTASTPATQQPGTVTPLPTPATPPATTTAPHRLDTSFFGVLDGVDEHGLPRIQVAETAGMVTRLWVTPWSWGGDEAAQIAGINAAGLPTTLDVSAHLWEPGDNASGLRYDARQRLEAYRARLEAAGALVHVDAISPIDEPNLDYRDKSGSIVAAVAIIRDVFPGLRVRCIYAGYRSPCSPELFDDIGADSYQGGDNVLLQGGVISNFALKLLPHQGLILVPGGADTRYRQPTPSEWVSYAQVHMALGRRVELCAFAWRTPADQPVLKGICDQPALRAAYEAAFRNLTA